MEEKVRKHTRGIIKYAIVSGIATLIDLAFLWFFTEKLGIYYLLSATFSFIIASTLNFLVSKRVVFNNKEEKVSRQYISFIIIGAIGLGLTILLLAYFVEKIGIYYLLARLIIAFISIFWNYALNSLITFKEEETNRKS